MISAKATWLKMPICYFQDVFVISNTATYDDSYNDYGYLAETLKCCTSTYNYNANAYKNSSNPNVKFEYPAVNCAAIRFGLLSKNGYQCSRATDSHLKLVTSISSYIRYRIIVNSGSNANIQAAYSHKELGVSSSIGISISGISISFTGGGKKTDYKASPVTIKA